MAKKIQIDEETCIGCGTCAVIAPGTFRMNEKTNKAEVIVPSTDEESTIQEAIDCCAVSAITVTEN